MAFTKDNSVVVAQRSKGWIELKGGGGNGNPTLLARNRTLTRKRTGVSLPKHRAIIAAGGDATTPMDASWDSLQWSKTNSIISSNVSATDHRVIEWTNSGDTSVCCNQGDVFPLGPYATASLTTAENLARAKFYKKVKQVSTEFQGITFLGELKESLHMLKHPGESLFKEADLYLKNVKRLKKSNPAKWERALPGLWLEHSFGWMPLINDAKSAASAIERLNQARYSRIVSASGKSDEDLTKIVLSSGQFDGLPKSFNGGCPYILNNQVKQVVTVRYKGKVSVTAEGSRWDDWALFGFSPKEFIPAAWELLPWSFLIDYFTNIGDILDSVTTNRQGITFTNRTQRTEVTWSRSGKLYAVDGLSPYPTSKLRYASGDLGSTIAKRTTVNRSPIAAVPLPQFEFNFSLTNGQLLNSAALLAQASSISTQKPSFNWRNTRRRA